MRLLLVELFSDAGFPPDVFQTFLIDTEQTGRVISDFRVKAVTLTGSERAGSQVARQAGERLKRVVLELGGSDPFIVMPSADLSAPYAQPSKHASLTADNPVSPRNDLLFTNLSLKNSNGYLSS